MTMVYARIADKTVAEEYFALTERSLGNATAHGPSRWTATSSPSAELHLLHSTIEF